MIRPNFLIVAGVNLGTLVLAGCGTSGHLAAPSAPESQSPVSSSIETHSPLRRATVQPFAGTAHLVPQAIRFGSSHPQKGWLWARLRGTNMLYHTTDGGHHWKMMWQSRSLLPQSLPDFVSSSRGWMPVVQGQYATVLTTTDGGHQWHSQSVRPTPFFLSFIFPTQNLSSWSWLIGQGYTQLGNRSDLTVYEMPPKTWRAISLAPVPIIRTPQTPAVTLVSSMTGFTVQDSNTLWVGTTGHGTQGDLKQISVQDRHAVVHSISLSRPGSSTSNRGQVSVEAPQFFGSQGVIMAFESRSNSPLTGDVWITQNGGATWHWQSRLPSAATQGQFMTTNTGFAWNLGTRDWWVTHNGGQKWHFSRLPFPVEQVDMANQDTIWLIAKISNTLSRLYHSSDGGNRWIEGNLPFIH